MSHEKRVHRIGEEIRRLKEEVEQEAKYINSLIPQREYDVTDREVVYRMERLIRMQNELAEKATVF